MKMLNFFFPAVLAVASIAIMGSALYLNHDSSHKFISAYQTGTVNANFDYRHVHPFLG